MRLALSRALVVLCVLHATAWGSPTGKHVRLETARGPVHVWTPPDYDAATAGTIVYVHGYFTDVDAAWKKHRLAAQFAESGINATFIACEAPRTIRDPVSWTSVDELLDEVTDEIGSLPDGRVIAVGHSAAHRTLLHWLDEDRLDTIILVDALYGDMPELREWLDSDPDRRLIDASIITRRWTDALHAELPETLVFDRFPAAKRGKLPGARRARVVYVRSQHDHMELVTGGVAIPMLLRALQLPLVDGASRTTPIRTP